MSQPLWRIASITPKYSADDTTGAGAMATGGRWNSPGNAVLYTALTPSMACLETMVHLGTSSLPMNRYLVRIDLPVAAWDKRLEHTEKTLPIGWDATPSGMVSTGVGDEWLRLMDTPVLAVPSVIVPEEFNVLINPIHPLTAGITATIVRKWTYDQRLLNRPRTIPIV